MDKPSNSLRLAHLSDPHFSKVTYRFNQFFSKRWMGNLNLLFFRKRAYQTEHLWHLPELLAAFNVDAVCITGDFSSTSLDEEFQEGKKFLEAFHTYGLLVYTLPGNHDCYTREAETSQRFYKFLPSSSLQTHRIECRPLPAKGWWYIGLDCAIATPLFCSFGHFLEETEHSLQETLATIPPTDKVVIANHFPLFTTGQPRHDLKRAQALQEMLKAYPQVVLYLHGHDHTPYTIDQQKAGYPLVLNAGSCAHKPDGTFYIIDLFENDCLVQQLFFRKEGGTISWVINNQQRYSLK